jgi:hypothetical protein
MTQEDRTYLLRRLETERRRSLEASTFKASEAHAALADAYESRLGAQIQKSEA